MKRWLWPVAILFLACAWFGCADDEECSGDGDCPGGQVCRSNKCATPEGGEGEGEACREDTDCPAPLLCDKRTGRCEEAESRDLGPDPGDTGGGDPADLGPDEPDVQDHTSPEVVRVTPAADARGVAVGVSVVVEFSEDLNERIVVAPAITLHNTWDLSGDEVDVDITWDSATRTATLTPKEPLSPYSTYKLVVLEAIKDLQGNHLVEFPDMFFTTAPDAEAEAFYGEIARRYAPHVFQETNRALVQADWLAAYDFDNEWRGDRKHRNWQAKKDLLAGAVYWNVTETKTHYFVTYAYYHPFDYDQRSVESVVRESGLVGAQVIVAKGGDHEGWQAVETYVGNDQIWSFSVEGKGIRARAAGDGGIGEFKQVMGADWLIDGTRYQAFIPYGDHQSCIWGYESQLLDLACLQDDAGEFYRGSGVHYVPGAGADGEVPVADVTACDGGCPFPGEACINGDCTAFAYGLRSLAAELWIRRHEYASLGEDIWSATMEYTPEPADDRRPGRGLRFPATFAGESGGTPGKPPWAWDDRADSQIAPGQWFIDPAHAIARRLEPAEGDVWATSARDYCWNIYLGVFERTAPGCSGAQ